MNYKICYLEEVTNKHIPMLSSNAKTLIKCAIEERLMFDPIAFGKPLRYSLKGHRRFRISDYRIMYRIEQRNIYGNYYCNQTQKRNISGIYINPVIS